MESGELGRLYVVRLAGHDPEPPHEAYIPASGGIFNDFSVHDFDVTRYLTGQEIVEVYADGDVLAFDMFAKYDDVDTAVATLRLSEGTRAILSCDAARPTRLRHPHRAVRVARQRQRRPRAADAAALGRAGRAATRWPGMESLSRTVRRCVS